MILNLNNKSIPVAEKIYSVWQESYIIEAEILKAKNFPPLNRTVHNFINSTTEFLCYEVGTSIAGIVELDKSSESIHIQSLVVSPDHFRKGIASKLIEYVLEKYATNDFTVETGVENIPAVNLYVKCGFVEVMQYDTDHGIRKIKLSLMRQTKN